MAIERKQLTGGLNSDTEDRLLPNGDFRYTLNVRASKSDGANEGQLENSKGNTLVNITLPNGINRVIGAYDDLEHNLVFYFLFNSNANHTIYEYDVVNNSVNTILRTHLLKFESTGYINDARVVGEQLFFNDRVNNPRKINYVRAKALGYPTPFKEEYINQIAYAPGFPPLTEFISDSTVNVNNVRGALRQFRTKFIYLDNEESAWSPISKTALPVDEAVYRPIGYYPTELNNGIDITFDIGDDSVTKVQIAVREGNTGDFMLVDEIDKSKITIVPNPSNTYTYRFFNDKSYTSLDNDGNSGMRLFDNVPKKADSQELIDGNRISYGGITEGFDPVDVDFDITVNRDTSVQVPAPSVPRQIGFNYSWRDFGVVPATDHWWVATNEPDLHLRIINGVTYQLEQATWQESRPSNASNPFVNNWNSTSIRTFTGAFTPGSTLDRVAYMKNVSTGVTLPTGGSVLNEVFVYDPPGVGVRYVLSMTMSWYDIGTSDALKSETFKVQYVSVAGDDAYAVCQGLITALNGLFPAVRGKVEIKFDQTQISGYSLANNAPAPAGVQSLQFWGEAYVPATHTVNPPYVPGVSKQWDISMGQDTPAAYSMSMELTGYADWTTENRKTLKSGANHSLGIVYYDDPNRSGLTNTLVEKSFYVPHLTEIAIPNGEVPNQTSLTININHLPPSWAKRYQFVYSGNQTIEKLPVSEGYMGFVQFQLKSVSTSTIAGAVECEISNLIAYNDSVPENIDLGYSFTDGDRIRFITEAINPSTLVSNYLQDYTDVEIISFDDLTNVLVFKDPGISVADNQLVEVYTPKKKIDEIVYSEIGECFDIVNGFHQGDNLQTTTTPATIELNDIGDVYLRYRTSPVTAQVEDYAFTDFYKSDAWDKGRPNIVDNNIKEIKRPSTIRFSNVYIPETNINGLSRFDDLDFEAYDQRYGSIQRMHSEDKDLTVFQNLKVGKVRIGQNTLYSNDGGAIATVKSENAVLSDIVYYQGEYGIGVNPESFAVYGNRKYFVDALRGAVLRLGNDGLTPISEYKMQNFFNDTFKSMVDAGGLYKVFGEYSVRFDEYIISIQDNVEAIDLVEIEFPESQTLPEEGTVAPAIILPRTELILDSDVSTKQTIAFSEYKKRWVTFYSFVPDYMVTNNIGFLSFKDGALYVHNENSVYNNFYGTQYSCAVELLSNAEPSSIKFYNNLFTESTHPFSVEATNQFGQKTSLLASDFVDDEGVFKAALLRDENTPNVTNPLFEGDEMRSHSMTIKLENTDTELVTIFALGIGLNLSQLTSK